jgi:prephenate dehydrogenase
MEESGFETDFLSASRVVIWGIGLMGGSLAMALKGKCAGLVGIDQDPSTVGLAQAWGLVDAAYTNPSDGLAGADLVILATPVRTILSNLAELDGLCSSPMVVIDLGSTKRLIVEAMAQLPERFDPLGGHPMCGKEKSSLQHAEAGIYKGAPFALINLKRTSTRAMKLAEELALAAGSRPLWIEAEEHDRWVAATSHAPYILSSALALATSAEARPLVGSGFRSTTRLAGSSAGMMVDILATNVDNIRIAIGEIKNRLVQYDDLLERADFEGLKGLLDQSAEQYRGLVDNG